MRNIDDETDNPINISKKIYFLCELAWEMTSREIMRISYDDLRSTIIRVFSKITDMPNEFIRDMRQLDYEIRNRTLLHADAEGYYRFAHWSFAEFFVALKFAKELGCISQTAKFKDIDGRNCEIPIQELSVSNLANTFGEISLRQSNLQNVLKFLSQLVKDDAPEKLWRIIDETGARIPNEVKFCGGNSAVLLQELGVRRPHPYEDITDLLSGMQKQPETVFPPRPASLDKIEKELRKANIWNESNQLTGLAIAGAEDVIRAYNAARDDNLEIASDLAKLVANQRNSMLNQLNLAIQGFSGLESLYLDKIEDAEKYFNRFFENHENEKHLYWYYLKIALVHIQRRNFVEAESLANLVLENSSDDLGIMGRSLLLLGILDRFKPDYRSSIDKFNQAQSYFRSTDDKYHEGTAFANLGITYRMTGEYEKAISNYNKAFDIFKLIGDQYRMACVFARLGTVYRMQKKYKEAIENYLMALKAFKNCGVDLESQTATKGKLVIGSIKRELGTTYLILGFWQDAIDHYNCAYELFSDLKDDPEAISKKGQTIYSLGLAYLMQGKWESAITGFKKALRIFQDRKDTYNISLAWSSLGTAWRMNDRPKKARPCLEKSLEIARILGDKKRVGLIEGKLGAVYRQLHEYDRAISYYNDSLQIAHMQGDPSWEAQILGSLGTAYRRRNRQDDIDEAERYYKASLEIFTRIGNKLKQNWILEELAQIYVIQGFPKNAIDMYKKALETERNARSDDLNKDENLIDISLALIIQSIFVGRVEKYEAARHEIEKLGNLALQARTLRNLGAAYHLIGEFTEAERSLDEALKISRMIKDFDQEAKSLCYLGKLQASLTDYKKSIKIIKEAIKVFQDLGDRFLEGWARENLGNVYFMQMTWKEAIREYKKSIDLNSKSWSANLSLLVSFRISGDGENAKEVCDRAREMLKNRGVSEYERACFEAVCGDSDRAFQLLENILSRGKVSMILVEQDPCLFYLRKDKRFENLSKQYSQIKDITIVPFI